MKIVQINSECGRGSTGKIAVAISTMLNENNIENYIFYSGNHTSNYSQGIKINSKFDLRIHQLLSRLFGNQGLHSNITTRRLIKKIKGIRPDIIHLHNIHGYYLNFKLLLNFLQDYDGKVIWTLHDCWSFTGHCAHFSMVNCDKWKHECFKCPQKRQYPYSLFFDRSRFLYNLKKSLFTNVKKLEIVTPSRWLAENVAQSFLKSQPIKVIENGINLSIFYPRKSSFRQKYGIENRYIILGVASVWSDRKGLDVIIDLCRLLDESYQIVLVGTDKNVDSIIPSSIISIHRTMDQNELAEIYSSADVFINPTKEETFPTVNMEAIACGTPVITAKVGGSPEILTPDCGIVLEQNNAFEMKNAIITLWERPLIFDVHMISIKYDEKICYKQYLQEYGI